MKIKPIDMSGVCCGIGNIFCKTHHPIYSQLHAGIRNGRGHSSETDHFSSNERER